MCDSKIELGQFFTKKDVWLKPQVRDFILQSKCDVAYDPFAGAGDLLNAVSNEFERTIGLDIDEKLSWEKNDSLLKIPSIENAIIITNPPYLAKNSATRKDAETKKYFKNSKFEDLYLIALEQMLLAQDFVVAIIPETFINSNFRKNRLASLTVLEENPFEDTENPVCVACFDNKNKDFSEIKVYKNETYINSLAEIFAVRFEPQNNLKITFNSKKGWLGLRAIDTLFPTNTIKFDFKENFNYDWEKGIKNTSRHLTLIDIDIPPASRAEFILNLNKIIKDIREESADLLLSAFKGNMKNGVRRRRLDYRLARAIIERVYSEMFRGDLFALLKKEAV